MSSSFFLERKKLWKEKSRKLVRALFLLEPEVDLDSGFEGFVDLWQVKVVEDFLYYFI